MKLLIPIDDRVFAEVILQFLKEQNWPKDNEIHVVHVIGPLELAFAWPNKVIKDEANDLVTAVVARFKQDMPGATVTSAVLEGAVVDQILNELDVIDADMIVMGSHARTNVGRAFMGSVSSAVVRASRRPVIVLRPPLKGKEEDGKPTQIQPIWLEQMSPDHERYFLEHVTQHPFPVDGSDWTRLIQLRLEHDYYHVHDRKCDCPDLITKLHSLGTPLEHEREVQWRAIQHWFLKGPSQYKPELESEDNMTRHALKVIAQLDASAHIKKAEKEWLKQRMKAWKPGKSPYWVADKGEAFESGTQLVAATPISAQKNTCEEVTTNVAPDEEE